MKRTIRIFVAALVAAAASGTARSSEVAWLAASTDSQIEGAFAQSRAERKPVLLYWGAQWCPPCNQLKATLFNRQDFVERSRSFVAVHIDGDSPGAQRLGARFKVIGYPTMILFNPAGAELTRLPGEADAAQVMQVLQLSLAGGRPIKTVLADARSGGKLTANEWSMLAFYSWETDEEQLAPASERSRLLATLAAASPAGEPRTRLWLRALAVGGDEATASDAASRRLVLDVLADPAAARAQMDVLTGAAPEIVKSLEPKAGAGRSRLLKAFESALKRLEADTTLSRADRLGALLARVDLARIDQAKDTPQPRVPAALREEVRRHAARADREIANGYERQAVITAAGYMLGRAGLWKDSDDLLKSNLSRSHSPYYLMSQLADNARKRGDTEQALDWYAQAFKASEGPATRLQWGASYLSALVDLTPKDVQRIERTASQILTEAAAQPNALHQRGARSLKRVGEKLASWSERGSHDDVIRRLRSQLEPVCGRLAAEDGQRAACEAVLKPAA
ncbi:MAG: thioredoxin family protein [Burkholderiales bacterium]